MAAADETRLPPEFDSNLANATSRVIDKLQEMGWKLRRVSGAQVGDYKYDCENVLRAAAIQLGKLADSVREEYEPNPDAERVE